MRNSSLEFQSKHNQWVCEKIQSGSKVVKQSLEACTLSASNTEVNDKNRFLWTLWRDSPINFSLELWNHLEFCRKPKSDSCRTLIGRFSNLLRFLLHLHFEYSLANKVYTFFWSTVYDIRRRDARCEMFISYLSVSSFHNKEMPERPRGECNPYREWGKHGFWSLQPILYQLFTPEFLLDDKKVCTFKFLHLSC